jgi:hypothetical protein
MGTKANDVIAIAKLYELRREEKMRAARAWYISEFAPQNAQDILQVLLGGFALSEKYRMVTSYWDMAASFVNNGGLDEKLFVESNTEYLVVFAAIAPYIAEVREVIGEPGYLSHLETLVRRRPDAEAVMERRRQLLARWREAAKAA